MKLIFSAIVVLIVASGVVLGALALSFSKTVARIEAQLLASPAGRVRGDLPAHVEAFARAGLLNNPPAEAARFEQDVLMRLEQGAPWQPLSARQTISASVPGFVWIAQQSLGPLPKVRVLDSYVSGRGLLDIRLLGAWRLGAFTGRAADLAEGYRYLAELPWMPDAILTNPDIIWTETDEGAAAQLDTAGGQAKVVFFFENGDITRMEAAGRPATQPDGTTAPMDWRGSFSNYAELGGRRVPLNGEVGYVYGHGFEAYFRAQITRYSVLASAAR